MVRVAVEAASSLAPATVAVDLAKSATRWAAVDPEAAAPAGVA